MRRRGFTIVEALVSLFLLTIVAGAAMALLVSSTQGFANTVADTRLTNSNAQGLRYVTERLRGAMMVTISGDDKLTYVMPRRADLADPDTGERENLEPLVGDGVTRSFTVNWANGTLTDDVTGRIICRNIVRRDPEPRSSQYNQIYEPFQLTSIGSSRAVTITLITEDQVGTQRRYIRLKTTVQLRNFRG
jgi:type II secretory pathway pseudopilin PulG